jgi:hypothetical protein
MSSRRTLKGTPPAEQIDENITRTVRRPTFSTSFRLNLFLMRKGLCAACTQKIEAGKSWDIDHILPLALGGTD